MDIQPVIRSLHFYPFKSCKAVDLTSAYAGPRGFVVGDILDRSWMLVDDNNMLVSQRQAPALARVAVELLTGKSGKAESIRLSNEGMAPLTLAQSSVTDERQNVIIHGGETVAHLASAEAHAWFSDFLGTPVRVVHQNADDVRLCDPNFAGKPGEDAVSFADGFQYLVTSEATLEKLNASLGDPVTMQRFRPNIVVGNTESSGEYAWRTITIGEVGLELVKPCTRCVMTTIDQDTGVKTGNDPLQTLVRTAFLVQDFGLVRVQGAIFGENAVPYAYGTIAVGDPVEVVATKRIYNFRKPAAPRR